MSKSANSLITRIESLAIFGIAFVGLTAALFHFTHLEQRISFSLAVLITATTQIILDSVSPKVKATRVVGIFAVVLLVYFTWNLWK